MVRSLCSLPRLGRDTRQPGTREILVPHLPYVIAYHVEVVDEDALVIFGHTFERATGTFDKWRILLRVVSRRHGREGRSRAEPMLRGAHRGATPVVQLILGPGSPLWPFSHYGLLLSWRETLSDTCTALIQQGSCRTKNSR